MVTLMQPTFQTQSELYLKNVYLKNQKQRMYDSVMGVQSRDHIKDNSQARMDSLEL